MSKKTRVICVRLTDAQHTKLEALAAQNRLSLTEYARARLTLADGEKILREAKRDLADLEHGAGNLRDQLAKTEREFDRAVLSATSEFRNLTERFRECETAFQRTFKRLDNFSWSWLATLLVGTFTTGILGAACTVVALRWLGLL